MTNILLLNSIGLESFEKEVSNCERKKIVGGHCTERSFVCSSVRSLYLLKNMRDILEYHL